MFVGQQKTKEIGIRKTLGASVTSVVSMLSKEFLKWVLVANVFAWPAAYWIMSKWLQGFAYRAELSVWVFALSGCGSWDCSDHHQLAGNTSRDDKSGRGVTL